MLRVEARHGKSNPPFRHQRWQVNTHTHTHTPVRLSPFIALHTTTTPSPTHQSNSTMERHANKYLVVRSDLHGDSKVAMVRSASSSSDHDAPSQSITPFLSPSQTPSSPLEAVYQGSMLSLIPGRYPNGSNDSISKHNTVQRTPLLRTVSSPQAASSSDPYPLFPSTLSSPSRRGLDSAGSGISASPSRRTVSTSRPSFRREVTLSSLETYRELPASNTSETVELLLQKVSRLMIPSDRKIPPSLILWRSGPLIDLNRGSWPCQDRRIAAVSLLGAPKQYGVPAERANRVLARSLALGTDRTTMTVYIRAAAALRYTLAACSAKSTNEKKSK